MNSKLKLLTGLLFSAALVSCGGGTGEKSTFSPNTQAENTQSANTETAKTEASNTDQTDSGFNNSIDAEVSNPTAPNPSDQTDSENSNPSESSTDTNKAFPDSVGCAGSKEDIQNSMLFLVNAARAQARMCGTTPYPAAPALVWNSKLEASALSHSLDMTTNNFFSHTGSNGLSVADRADAVQYNWRAIGENIAAGQPTADIAVQEWLDSPGHCENIMSGNYEELAVACVSDDGAQYKHYWTQVFGTRF